MRVSFSDRFGGPETKRSSDCSCCWLLCAAPAPGFRDAGNNGKFGALVNVGNNGFSWSSSVSGSNGVYLNFNTTNLNPSNVNNRAHGLQVRCLRVFIRFRAGRGKMCIVFLFPAFGG